MGRGYTLRQRGPMAHSRRGPEKEKLVRYRLRFVLQELDLPVGGTIIGRSLDCHLTLEDPLVSRRHARIFVDETGARIEDMGSRNGVRLNGAVIREPVALRNGDRVRIGTHDFVFCCVDPGARAHSKTTGHLRLCANCRLPYPRELLACPNCEATEQTDDDTLTGSGGSSSQGWNVQLMVESLERALRLGRVPDAVRIVQRAIAQLEELFVAGGTIDSQPLAELATQAAATTLVTRRSHLGTLGGERVRPHPTRSPRSPSSIAWRRSSLNFKSPHSENIVRPCGRRCANSSVVSSSARFAGRAPR